MYNFNSKTNKEIAEVMIDDLIKNHEDYLWEALCSTDLNGYYQGGNLLRLTRARVECSIVPIHNQKKIDSLIS